MPQCVSYENIKIPACGGRAQVPYQVTRLALLAACFSDVVEQVLLGNAAVLAEIFACEGLHASGIAFVESVDLMHHAAHPHIDWEGVELTEAEQRGASCYLRADTLECAQACDDLG